jgi:hypothetical protein
MREEIHSKFAGVDIKILGSVVMKLSMYFALIF